MSQLSAIIPQAFFTRQTFYLTSFDILTTFKRKLRYVRKYQYKVLNKVLTCWIAGPERLTIKMTILSSPYPSRELDWLTRYHLYRFLTFFLTFYFERISGPTSRLPDSNSLQSMVSRWNFSTDMSFSIWEEASHSWNEGLLRVTKVSFCRNVIFLPGLITHFLRSHPPNKKRRGTITDLGASFNHGI